MVMEAHKERREQVEKEEEIMRRGSRKTSNEDNDRSNKLGDPVTQRVIRETVVSGHNENERAQHPNDVLAFSRSVHNVDSSLE